MESTTQIFLRVQVSEAESDFVGGEAMALGYADRVQIDSFNFGMKGKLQTPPKPGEKVSNNLDFDQLEATKVFDRASMRLAALLKNRTQLEEVRVTVDQQLEEVGVGKAQNAIIVFHLYQARLVSISLDVSEDDRAATVSETLSFSFRNFSVEYYYKSLKNNKKSDYRDAWLGFQTEYDVQD
jgi:type VI protein secretion system component Hcp